MGISKLRIKPTDQGLHIFRSAELGEKYNEGVFATREEIIAALLEMNDSDKFIAELQEKKLTKNKEKKEQLEKFKPVGFDKYASSHAKSYREEVLQEGADGNQEAINEMRHLQKILAYNEDNTITLIPIDEILCVDFGLGEKKNWNDCNQLVESKGYRLLSSKSLGTKVNADADFAKLTRIFGKYLSNGSFQAMLDLTHGPYWTSTKYDDESLDQENGASCKVMCPFIETYSYQSVVLDINDVAHVIGFKKKDSI